MRAIPLLTLLLSGWFHCPAHADEAQDWLTRLGQAEQQHSFQGTFVYERNGSFSTHDIWHRVQDGQVRERLVAARWLRPGSCAGRWPYPMRQRHAGCWPWSIP